ncbi:MAG TPA: ferritin-like domain-containing protein [Acidimicrobiales bacterium]|nr:ferritin-like domain-containing protein [Acidimicrobiales bacterium]
MEISARELRSLTRDVDEQHHDGLATLASDIADLHSSTRPLRRRQVLRGAGVGAAIVIGAAVLPIDSLVAAAQTATTEKPRDDELAAFGESIELAIVDAYADAIATGKLSAPVAQTITQFSGHHSDHAKALAAAGGSKAKGKANSGVVARARDQLSNARDEKGVVKICTDLENSASSTYLYVLGVMQSSSALQLAASILPVESAHAMVLSQVTGGELLAQFPAVADTGFKNNSFEVTTRAFDLQKFTINPTTTTSTK